MADPIEGQLALTKTAVLQQARAGVGCLGKAADDEPVFCLRAADRSAPRVIREWVRFAATQGCPEGKLDGALLIADAMSAWQAANPGKTKWPD